jgi:hypothetical protein
MWGIKMVDCKDSPPNQTKDYNDKGDKTVGLLLHMTKNIWYQGIFLVLDSGFWVLQTLVELQKFGVFGAAVIKKRRYWPKYIDGDAISNHFVGKQVGHFDILQDKLYGVKFGIFAMKEPDYVMLLMATYGTLEPEEKSNAVQSTIKNDGENRMHYFKCTELFYNHFA